MSSNEEYQCPYKLSVLNDDSLHYGKKEIALSPNKIQCKNSKGQIVPCIQKWMNEGDNPNSTVNLDELKKYPRIQKDLQVTMNGKPGWMYGGGTEYLVDSEAEVYIKRQIDRDPDLWVVEIDDPKGRFFLDDNII